MVGNNGLMQRNGFHRFACIREDGNRRDRRKRESHQPPSRYAHTQLSNIYPAKRTTEPSCTELFQRLCDSWLGDHAHHENLSAREGKRQSDVGDLVIVSANLSLCKGLLHMASLGTFLAGFA